MNRNPDSSFIGDEYQETYYTHDEMAPITGPYHSPTVIVSGGYSDLGMTSNDVLSYTALREDQKPLIDKALALGRHDRGLYFVLPTGYGKTYLMAVLTEIAQMSGNVVVLLCPKAVSEHARKVLAELGVSYPVILHHKSVNIRSEIKKASLRGEDITFMIDEAHNLLSETGTEIINTMRVAIGRTGKIYMFTATPVKTHLSDLSLIRTCWSDRDLANNSDSLPDDKDVFDNIYKNRESGDYDLAAILQCIMRCIIYRKSNADVPAVAETRYEIAELNYAESYHEHTSGVAFTKMMSVRRKAELTEEKFHHIAKIAGASSRPIVVFTNFIGILHEESLKSSSFQSSIFGHTLNADLKSVDKVLVTIYFFFSVIYVCPSHRVLYHNSL